MSKPNEQHPTETLSPDELAYHKRLIEQQHETMGAVRSWSAFLGDKYKLTPGDGVTDDGAIVRQAQAAPPVSIGGEPAAAG